MNRGWKLIVFAAVFAGLALAAAGMLFSTLMAYDDEGYVLYSFKQFAEHGHLYGEVFSQYGPFPFEFSLLLHSLGLPFTIDAGRMVGLVEWSLSALLLSGIVWRATRSFAFTIFALAASFSILWVSSAEPNHPGNLIAVLVALLAFTPFHARSQERGFLWIAVLSALLVFTKINVGVLASFAAFAAMALAAPSGRLRPLVIGLVAFLAALVPFVLMKALIQEDWVVTFALLSASGGIAAVLAASRESQEPLQPRVWLKSIGAGIAAAVLVLGFAWARHSSADDLLRGILLEPMLHPVRYHAQLTWPANIRWETGVSLGALAAMWLLARTGPEGTARAATTVALLRLIAFAGLCIPFLRYPDVLPERLLFPYVAPWVWLFLWPVAAKPGPFAGARVYLGLLLWGQWLHAYPVPGSQIAWGVYLSIPLACIGTWEALQVLGEAWVFLNRTAGAVVVSLLILAPAAKAASGMFSVASRYRQSESIGLPGTSLLRVPDKTTATYQTLVMNARSYADVLFTNSGMFSFNLWTGLPTPTLANVTQWFLMLSPEQHEAIIRQLEAHPRACVIQSDDILGVLARQHTSVESPTTTYLQEHYHKAFSAEGFEFLVRNGRTIRPLGFYEVFHNPSGNALIRFDLDAGNAMEVASLAQGSADSEQPAVEARGLVRVTPISEEGSAAGPSINGTLPISLSGRVRVEVVMQGPFPTPTLESSILVARDGAGRRLAVLRPSE